MNISSFLSFPQVEIHLTDIIRHSRMSLTSNRSCMLFGLRLTNGAEMGTYTSNYNLFLPTIGEQGWGELVNGNFETIDTTMSGLNARTGALETETDAIEERVTVLEAGEFETVNVAGTIVADSVTANKLSGISTLTPTKITLYTPYNFNTDRVRNSTTITYTISAYPSNILLPYDEMEYTLSTVCGVTNYENMKSYTVTTVTDTNTNDVLYTKSLSATGHDYQSNSDSVTIIVNPYHTTTMVIQFTTSVGGYANSSFTATTTAGTVYL